MIDNISIYKLNVLKVIVPIALLDLILGLIIPWNHKVNFTIEWNDLMWVMKNKFVGLWKSGGKKASTTHNRLLFILLVLAWCGL